MSFVHLHTHTHYSLLEAIGTPEKILDRAKELGMNAMAITDYSNLYGAIEWFTMARARDIKPIIGCEVFIAPYGMKNMGTSPEDKVINNLTLLAKDADGYQNLMHIVTTAHLDGFYMKPRVDKEVLKKYSKGLIALSGCLEGEVPQALIKGDHEGAQKIAQEYEAIFGKENFYLEMQYHPRIDEQQLANKGIAQLSKTTGIPLVVTGDIHYVDPNDSPMHEVVLCIKDNRKIYETDRRTMTDYDLHIQTPQEIEKAFKDYPEAIENTQKIADRCNLEITLGEIQLPHYPLPQGETPLTHLRKMTEDGMHKKFGENISQEYWDRMNFELEIIEKMGYPAYFLIVQDFVNWAREQGIVVGPGRGSAAGSLVSYVIGITNLDPIKYSLLFERFLNPERISMPDVDMDFADDRRDDVLEYCREKYGWDHVAQIITFGTMAARAAIRDVGRAQGLSYDFCDKTAKLIPMFTSMQKALESVPEFKELYDKNEDAKNLITTSLKLEGNCRHASIHACGVVITKNPVVEYTPIQRVAGDDHAVCTQYSCSSKTSYVEKIGLLKMDFLGLKNLTIIQNTLRIIKKLYDVEIDIENIPLDDDLTYELLQRGETTGVFQLESSGMKRYLKLLKPTVFEDIIAMVALYRPGPMDWIPDFIGGKHGTKTVKYLHPKLEPILQNTYGVAVYQEQVMQIAQALAGFSLGEADILRKAMGKKILELIKEQKIMFVEGCVREGVSKKIAEKIFEFIEPFAGYGFNRSHAACYALIGYQTAYLKAHYPAAFMAALLTSDQDNSDRIAIEVSECKDMGIEVFPPNVNESFEEFAVIQEEGTDKEFIRFGLNAIKNVGKPAAKEVVAERQRGGKYTTLSKFIERIRSKDLNKKSIDALAKVGALDELAERNRILKNIESVLAFSKNLHLNADSNQTSLFAGADIAPPTIQLASVKPATKKEKLSWEKELLGLYVSDHPTSEYADYLDKVTTPINTIDVSMADRDIRVGGVIQTMKKIYLKTQKTMMFVMIENLRGRIEVIFFPKTLEKFEEALQPDRLILVDGKVSNKDGECKILVEDIKPLDDKEVETLKRIEATKKKFKKMDTSACDVKNTGGKLLIEVGTATSKQTLQTLSDFLSQCAPGDIPVVINIDEKEIETSYSIQLTEDVMNTIKEMLGCSVE